MDCVELVNYEILINGSPTNYFRGTNGVRQDFPLSPLLFLIIIKGLGKLIECSRDSGNITGIKISSLIKITRLLFVDDVMIFGVARKRECMFTRAF